MDYALPHFKAGDRSNKYGILPVPMLQLFLGVMAECAARRAMFWVKGIGLKLFLFRPG